MIKDSLNPEGHQNPISGSKVTAILLKRWTLPIGGASLGRVCACRQRSMLVYSPKYGSWRFHSLKTEIDVPACNVSYGVLLLPLLLLLVHTTTTTTTVHSCIQCNIIKNLWKGKQLKHLGEIGDLCSFVANNNFLLLLFFLQLQLYTNSFNQLYSVKQLLYIKIESYVPCVQFVSMVTGNNRAMVQLLIFSVLSGIMWDSFIRTFI